MVCQQVFRGVGAGGAMVLGKFLVPGRPANLDYSKAMPTALAVGAYGGRVDIFSIVYHFSSFSLSREGGPTKTEILSQRAVKPKATYRWLVVLGLTAL